LPYETKGAELILFLAEFSYTAVTIQKVDAAFPSKDCQICLFMYPFGFFGLFSEKYAYLHMISQVCRAKKVDGRGESCRILYGVRQRF
jgi:hypothetical protein